MFKDIRFQTVAKAALVTLVIFAIHITLSYLFIRTSTLGDIKKNLRNFTDRVEKDLVYSNGTWNINKYDADPQTPHPNGSSGYSKPLYVITSEGYIIERSEPITGLLDVSDYKYLSQFSEPQTITTVANEKWRVLSMPIVENGRTLGVIMTALYDPNDRIISEIDTRLEKTVNDIRNALTIYQGKIDTSALDIRNIHYEYSFVIVDSFNNVLASNGRTPSYIDVSYVKKWLEEPRDTIIRDEHTGEEYYLVSKNIIHQGSPIGLIIAAEPITFLETLLKKLLIFSLITAILLAFPFIMFLFGTIAEVFGNILKNEKTGVREITLLKKVYFDKKNSTLILNDEEYQIPFASNQYYLCEAVFSAPTKRWEIDELLEKMGEDTEDTPNTRTVYDAMLAIHKRVKYKLIEYKDKTYFLNPALRSVIQK
jgi:hypothetical protein